MTLSEHIKERMKRAPQRVLTEQAAFDLLNSPSMQASNYGAKDKGLFINRTISQDFIY